MLSYKYYLKVRSMRSQEEELALMSPTAFIVELQSHVPSDLDLNLQESSVRVDSIQKKSEGTRTYSRQEKKRLAGVRSRQKKKKYVEELEQSAKSLASEVQRYQSQISKCKDQLVEAIRTANSQSNQHAFTYSQLEQQALSEDPDIDTINHLLDLIQSRIGANAKERQAKLDYCFKQITNSLFPATHRYFMYCAENEVDIFAQNLTPQVLEDNSTNRWTLELYNKLKLDEGQLKRQEKFKQAFIKKRQQSVECIKRLRMIKDEMKRQEQVFQRGISEFRLDLDPVQSALITVFGEKNKLRREFSIGEDFQQPPRKHIKLDQ